MKKIAIFADFDLTLSEEYQQMPLIKDNLDKYKEYYKNNKFKYLPENFEFSNEKDFFKILQLERKYILDNVKNSRIQNGVTWLHKLVNDLNIGPLKHLSQNDIYEYGKKIKISPGVLDCFIRLKNEWFKKNIEIKIYIVSVGLKTLIEGAIDGEIEKKNFEKNPIDGIYAAEILETEEKNMRFKMLSIIEDYSKTEIAYEISKGGKNFRDEKLNFNEYIIPHNQFLVLGDGFSDVPMFRFFRKKGSMCIMVFKKGCMKSFQKLFLDAFKNVDYLLERNYLPIKNNATWIYINECINTLSKRNYKHSDISIYNYKWSKRMSKSEKDEIEKFIIESPEHNFGNTLTYVIPKI